MEIVTRASQHPVAAEGRKPRGTGSIPHRRHPSSRGSHEGLRTKDRATLSLPGAAPGTAVPSRGLTTPQLASPISPLGGGMLQRDCSERAPRGAEEPGKGTPERRTGATPRVCPEHTLWGAGRIGYFLFFFFFFSFLSFSLLFQLGYLHRPHATHTSSTRGSEQETRNRSATAPALPHRLPRSPSAVPAVTRPAPRPHVCAGSHPGGHRSSARASSGRGS